jgi:exodeoxyribonuclease V alpha subunit
MTVPENGPEPPPQVTPQQQRLFSGPGTGAEQAPLVTVEGAVDKIMFENADTGFVVGRLIPETGGEAPVTFVGKMLSFSPGDTVRLTGRHEENPKFGRQLRVERFDLIVPSTVDGIERYLASGLVDGIGPKLAERIVRAFGAETFRVIEQEPDRLRKVEGIGKKRVGQIREAWERQRAIQSIMVFLQGHGIATGQAVRIYRCYGDRAIAVLREDPYRLATEVPGFAFKTADAVAREMGTAPDAPGRITAGMAYALEAAASEGHTYLPRAEALRRAAALLGLDEEVIAPVVANTPPGCEYLNDGDALCLPRHSQAEFRVAALLHTLLTAPRQEVPIDVPKALRWVEKTLSIHLSPEQADAIRTVVASKVMVITGGPGTGKTTVLRGVLDIFERKGLSPLLAAPTGRAAKRMEAASGRPASTLHRLLEFSPRTGGFLRNAANPIEADFIVVDECSMVDIQLMHAFLEAVPPMSRLLLVGDVDQLPSVGPGNVLLDILSSQAVPAVWLKTVFRQASESGIIANAHRINRGEEPLANDSDFFIVARSTPDRIRETIVELVTRRIPDKFGLDPRRDIQVLAPMHRGEAGVASLNLALQRTLNPGVERVRGHAFGPGDKVMQQRNNYELDVFNGDAGVVVQMDEDLNELEVRFDDERRVLYPALTLDELGLAYAITVHKAQGSEYPAVVMPMTMQHYMMLQRNVLYTGITRASRLVILVGEDRALGRAVKNVEVARRFTRLSDRIRDAAATRR